MLRNWGMRPVAAGSADEALRLLREAARRGEPFPLVLSDVNMPDVDGFELVERCRDDEALRQTVFMMLTSATRSGDVARCKELGIAAHLVKPVKQSELYDCDHARRLGVARPGRSTPHRHSRPRAGERPLRILLAEDSRGQPEAGDRPAVQVGHTRRRWRPTAARRSTGHVRRARSIWS